MLHQGKLKNWNPTQGNGFIQPNKAGPDICISSSGFRKRPEKLEDGDSIFFQIEVDPQGKPKAVLAYKAGQHFVPAPAVKKPVLLSLRFQQVLSALVSLSILAWFGYQSLYLFSSKPASSEVVEPVETDDQQSKTTSADYPAWSTMQTQDSMQFKCEGKQHCSEMSSCDEAKFYLKNCPNVLIDGDNDGRPCEDNCGHSRF